VHQQLQIKFRANLQIILSQFLSSSLKGWVAYQSGALHGASSGCTTVCTVTGENGRFFVSGLQTGSVGML
jgi:hypothetical protein